MEFSRNKIATFEFKEAYINQDILKQFLDQYNIWQDEWKQYILGRMISSRPRGLGKVNTWWYNIFRISKILFEFRDKMKDEYDTIGLPLYYDYGHYFTKEKYETVKEPVWQKVDYYHINEWVPYVLKDVTRKVENNGYTS